MIIDRGLNKAVLWPMKVGLASTSLPKDVVGKLATAEDLEGALVQQNKIESNTDRYSIIWKSNCTVI